MVLCHSVNFNHNNLKKYIYYNHNHNAAVYLIDIVQMLTEST